MKYAFRKKADGTKEILVQGGAGSSSGGSGGGLTQADVEQIVQNALKNFSGADGVGAVEYDATTKTLKLKSI